MDVQKISNQKLFELEIGMWNYSVEFVAANKQFDCLLILIVTDKSDEQQTIYDSYYMELASNKLKFDRINSSEKYLVYIQYLAWVCNDCLIAPLKDYASNPIF